MPHSPAPYAPFKTFLNALDSLERGLPDQLDRSLWPSYSGAIQGQLLGAFRSLGLVDENLRPTAELGELVTRRDHRRQILRRVLEHSYEPMKGIDLGRASPRQLDEAMRGYGLSGATQKKALSFFLQAASFAGVPLSPLLKGKTRGGAARKRTAEPAPRLEAPSTLSRTVELRSGGTLTLAAAVDLFSISPEDRRFLFELVDRMQAYERQTP
jgi:hypothetical protein